MNKYAGNKVPYRATPENTGSTKSTTLYSSIWPYIVVGLLGGLGAFAAVHPDVIQPFEQQLNERIQRAPMISQPVASDAIDDTHQQLIDEGYITVQKVPHGWTPNDLR